MTNAAPELAGKWELALYPGIRDEKGRYSAFTSSAAESCVVCTSSAASRGLGLPDGGCPQYRPISPSCFRRPWATSTWNSASLAALEQAAWNPEHKAVILEQPSGPGRSQVPGGYMSGGRYPALDAVIAGASCSPPSTTRTA